MCGSPSLYPTDGLNVQSHSFICSPSTLWFRVWRKKEEEKKKHPILKQRKEKLKNLRLIIVVPNGWVERPVTFVHLLYPSTLWFRVWRKKEKKNQQHPTKKILNKERKIKKIAAHHRCTQRMGWTSSCIRPFALSQHALVQRLKKKKKKKNKIQKWKNKERKSKKNARRKIK